MKCEKFVVCNAKTLAKYPQNVKYDKCIVDLKDHAELNRIAFFLQHVHVAVENEDILSGL